VLKPSLLARVPRDFVKRCGKSVFQGCSADRARLPDAATRNSLSGGSTYEPVPREGPRVRAQEVLHEAAVESARLAEPSLERFRPLVPDKE